MSEAAPVSSPSFYDRLFPPTWTQIGVVTAVLFLFGLAAILLDGLWTTFIHERLWSRMFIAPVIIIYIISI